MRQLQTWEIVHDIILNEKSIIQSMYFCGGKLIGKGKAQTKQVFSLDGKILNVFLYFSYSLY